MVRPGVASDVGPGAGGERGQGHGEEYPHNRPHAFKPPTLHFGKDCRIGRKGQSGLHRLRRSPSRGGMRRDGHSMRDLIAKRAAGCALPQAFYVADEVFARDMDLLLGGWTLLGHESEIAAPGDWITAGFGRESAIIVRGEDGVVRALANVCRHRGSRVCVEAHGSAAGFTYPYHPSSYRPDILLRAAREMPDALDPTAFSVMSQPLAIV